MRSIDGDGLRVIGICEKEAIQETHDRLAFVSMCPAGREEKAE